MYHIHVHQTRLRRPQLMNKDIDFDVMDTHTSSRKITTVHKINHV